jgi:hypothetical protein
MASPSRQALLGATRPGDPVENAIRDLVNEVGMLEVPERPAGGLTTRKSPEQWEQDYRKSQFLRLARERAEAAQPEGATWYKGLPDDLRNEVEAYHKKTGFFGLGDSQYKQDLESVNNSLAGDNPIYHAGRWIGSMLEMPFRGASILGDDLADAVGPMFAGKDYQPLPAAYKQREREKWWHAHNTFFGPLAGGGPSYWKDLEDSKLRARRQTPGVLPGGRFTPYAKWYQSQVPNREQAREVAAEYNYRNIPGETSPSELLMERGVPSWLAYATGIPGSIMLDPFSSFGAPAKFARTAGKHLLSPGSIGVDAGLGSMEVWMPAVTQGIRRLVGEVNKDGRR